MIKLQQGTQEWLDWRLNGITATEAACALGVSKWGSPLSIFRDKLNPQPHEQSKYEEWGTLLEDVIKFKKFAKMHPEFEVRQGECYEDDWRKCSLDGELWQDGKCQAILEIKTGRNESDWDPIPEYYKAQVMWQMHVTGIHKVYFAVLINGCDYLEREIEYDKEYADRLEQARLKLWTCIINKTAPEPTNPNIDQDIISEIATKTEDKESTFEVPEDDVKLYRELVKQADKIDLALKAMKLKLTGYLVQADRLMYKGTNFGTMVNCKGKDSVDVKLLQSQFPEIYSKVLKTGKPYSYPKFG
jgi:putative phage-type endonuclease